MRGHGGSRYTTRVLKGGALLAEMRLLVRSWGNGKAALQQDQGVRANILAKESRSRAADIYNAAFLPRFVRGPIRDAWLIARTLEERGCQMELLRPVYYWITARSEPLLYEFTTGFLYHQAVSDQREVAVSHVQTWLRAELSKQKLSWSESTTLKVCQELLAMARDFGVLEGKRRKRIAPSHLPIRAVAFLAFLMSHEARSGQRLVEHPDWRLFLLTPQAVEHLLLEAHQRHLLAYHAAGRIVRVEFPCDSVEGMADVVSAEAD